MKIAFLGRAIHEKTQSDAFFIDLLKQVGEVTVWRRENLGSRQCVDEVNALQPDLTIFFQLPPSISHHLLRLRSKRKIWVPMWDGFAPLNWKKRLAYRWAGLEAISFCNPVHNHLSASGIPSLQVQYFPAPISASPLPPQPPYTFFLWQRDPNIGLSLIQNAFPTEQIKKILYKSDFATKIPPSLPIEILEGWIPKEQLLEKIAEADFYIAPRLQEGIGFSFLEAMAMQKIVLAHDAATMNEYIQDGRTGYLFDKEGNFRYFIASPATLESNLRESTDQMHHQWLKDKQKLLDLLRG